MPDQGLNMRKPGEITRKKILDIFTSENKPLSAYHILAVMKRKNNKIAPPTVYRALTSLTETGSAHRIESLNAYVACSNHDHEDTAVMTICDDCGVVEEQTSPEVVNSIEKLSDMSGFKTKRHVIELHGQCADCNGVE